MNEIPAAWQRPVAALAARARADPFFDRYVRARLPLLPQPRIGGGKAPPIRTVAEALGERWCAAILMCSLEMDLALDPEALPNEWPIRLALAAEILDAQVFLWRDAVYREATGIDVPAHQVSPQILPFPRMWWTFETARLSRTGASIDWLFLHEKPDGNGFEYVMPVVADDDQPEHVFHGGYVRYGSRFPEDLPAGSDQLLGLLAFLNSPYIETMPQRADRAARREFERLGPAAWPYAPEVNVVQLRSRPAPEREQADAPGATRGADGHWWVRGHIRRQWHPSEQAHHLQWIAAHIAGDPGKPLKGHAYHVVR